MGIDLSKKLEKVTICLTKKNVKTACMRVGAAFDVSGSMDDEYRSGIVQETVDRVFALANKFDDNGELENWIFSHNAWQIGPVTKDNVDGFVKREVMGANKSGMWSGTSYAPALQLITNYYGNIQQKEVSKSVQTTVEKQPSGLFGKVKSLFGAKETEVITTIEKTIENVVVPSETLEYPGYLIFITDGDNSDQNETIKVLDQLAKLPVYVQFVGIGNDTTFNFLRKMGEKYDQVGFMQIKNLRTTSDETLYEELLNDELIGFLKTKHPHAITGL